MPSPYQEFVRKAKERFQERERQKKNQVRGGVRFTLHARYKMQQYNLSEQKVKGIIRNPYRIEKGIAPRTTAVMQPVSPKVINGKETWKQEIWTMYIKEKKRKKGDAAHSLLQAPEMRIISAWRYPGVSPKGNAIPEEILQELADSEVLEG